MPGGQARRVPLVGLTGGLGAGKSTALAMLSDMGAATLSTDAVVHELYETPAVRDAVVARWGSEVAPDGVVDRGAIASRAFADSAEREWLEQLLWPLVRGRVNEFRESAIHADPAPRAIVIETPLLFEAGTESQYDNTVAIITDDDLRVARALARGHNEFDARDARQLPQAEKQARADYTIRNDGTLEEFSSALADLLATLEVSIR